MLIGLGEHAIKTRHGTMVNKWKAYKQNTKTPNKYESSLSMVHAVQGQVLRS